MSYAFDKCLICKRNLNEDEKDEGVCCKCQEREDARHNSKHKDYE